MIVKPTVLIVTPDVVGKKMAGPGIRYVQIAREVSKHTKVIFAVGVEGSSHVDFGDSPVEVVAYKSLDELKLTIDRVDVVFCQFIDTNAIRHALSKNKRVIYDFYNVLPIETVGAEVISGYTNNGDKDREFKELIKFFTFCSQTGSYFVTSNDRQRDFWMGYIMSSGAIIPSNVNGKSVDQIIGLAPFGTENTPPKSSSHALRGKYGITKDDFVLLWCGGIWDWFDAETPIRAVADLQKTHPDVKLVFYGTIHPNNNVSYPKNVDRAIKLAKRLGVYQKSVIFQEGWVPADERSNYLLDADVAISTHLDSLETRYAFRTRILDHFWAGLPTIATRGDWFTEYIEKNDLGIGVDAKDTEAVRSAIINLLENKNVKKRISGNVLNIRDQWTWSKTLGDLVGAIMNFRQLPVRELPELQTPSYMSPYSYIKQTKLVENIKKTPAWPALKKIKNKIRK